MLTSVTRITKKSDRKEGTMIEKIIMLLIALDILLVALKLNQL